MPKTDTALTPKVHPIRAARQRRGWSQSDLGTKVGTGKAAVSKWERGDGFPDPRVALQVASVLHIPLDDVYASARAA